MLTLPRELRIVAEVLQLAAAALVVDRTGRSHPVRTCLNHIQQFGVTILLFRLQHLDPGFLARQGACHKQRIALGPADAFAVVVHPDDVNHDFIVFRYGKAGDHRIGHRRTPPRFKTASGFASPSATASIATSQVFFSSGTTHPTATGTIVVTPLLLHHVLLLCSTEPVPQICFHPT
ncbi:hypothetical protein D3C74_347590 [compost metagenome]